MLDPKLGPLCSLCDLTDGAPNGAAVAASMLLNAARHLPPARVPRASRPLPAGGLLRLPLRRGARHLCGRCTEPCWLHASPVEWPFWLLHASCAAVCVASLLTLAAVPRRRMRRFHRCRLRRCSTLPHASPQCHAAAIATCVATCAYLCHTMCLAAAKAMCISPTHCLPCNRRGRLRCPDIPPSISQLDLSLFSHLQAKALSVKA